MTQFDLWVPVDKLILECCDVAVAVDRQVWPHMRKNGEPISGPLDHYRIYRDDHDVHKPNPEKVGYPAAFINAGGYWQHQCSSIPQEIEGWHDEVREWAHDVTRFKRIVIARCHD